MVNLVKLITCDNSMCQQRSWLSPSLSLSLYLSLPPPHLPLNLPFACMFKYSAVALRLCISISLLSQCLDVTT